jgi:hypothetical protein
LELLLEVPETGIVLGHDDDAGGVPVEAMDQPRPPLPTDTG